MYFNLVVDSMFFVVKFFVVIGVYFEVVESKFFFDVFFESYVFF